MPVRRAFAVLAAAAVLVMGCATSEPMAGFADRAQPATESGFLAGHVQLTFPERFAKAGEAYFSPDGNWIIFQAVPAPPAGEDASPHYSMYVAKLRRDGSARVIGLDQVTLISEPGSANTCGWFHPSLPGVVLFGSTMTPPAAGDAPGYSRGSGRYTWQFPPEMSVVTRTVEAIVRDRAHDATERASLLARPDVDRAVPVVVHDGYCAEASWSRDGRTILYTQVDPTTGDGDLYAYIMATGEKRPLVVAPGYDGGPFFSPSGRFICYRSDRRGDNLLQLFVSELEFDEDGLPSAVRAEYQLTDDQNVSWAPFWHPSGRYMVFATSAVSHRNYEVFAIPFDPDDPGATRESVRITRAEGFDGLPVFSPNGRLMMWTAQRGDDTANDGRPSSQLWLADAVTDVPPALMPAIGGIDAGPFGAPIKRALAAVSPEVRRFNDHVVTLANPFLEGRLPGSSGSEVAKDYIEFWLRAAGLTPAFPAPDGASFASYRQPFDVRLESSFSGNGSAPVVRAGNVGGLLAGRGALADELIVVGAHHDHLGHGAYGSRSGEGEIHEGADDNASGVAGVLLLAEQLAAAFAELPDATPRRSILFMTFDAEESGLNGSDHYVEHPVVPMDRHFLMINFDMIGRMDDGRASLAGTNSAAGLLDLVRPHLTATALDVLIEEALPGRSDHMPFYRRQVPVLFCIDGTLPEEYHTSDDESWLINRVAAVEAMRLFTGVLEDAATEPRRLAFQEIAGADQAAGPAMGEIKVRFGIMPGNYNDPEPGIEIERVSPDTSASRAGLLAGDRMMTWNGAALGGVSDWMSQMANHRPGDVVQVGVLRDGTMMTIPVELFAREEK